jgi:hypothetical protein
MYVDLDTETEDPPTDNTDVGLSAGDGSLYPGLSRNRGDSDTMTTSGPDSLHTTDPLCGPGFFSDKLRKTHPAPQAMLELDDPDAPAVPVSLTDTG